MLATYAIAVVPLLKVKRVTMKNELICGDAMDNLRAWCIAITNDDRRAAREAFLADAGKTINIEKMDEKEIEIYSAISEDIRTRLTVIAKCDDGLTLGYALDSAKPRHGANIQAIGKVKTGIMAELGDTLICKIDSVHPVLITGKYGCTASGIRVLHKTTGAPCTAQEIFKAAAETGSLIANAAIMDGIKKARLIHAPSGPAKVSRETHIAKSDDEKQLVYIVIYEPSGDEGEPINYDTDGQYATRDDVEDAAHWYMENGAAVNLMHSRPLGSEASIVESYIAPCDFQLGNEMVKQGSWVGVFHITDLDIWQAYKEGDLTGVSIQGAGKLITEA
jgi:hypothetical protein